MKKITSFFPHDSNARNDERIIRLRMKHKSAGYGIYFMILERMRSNENYMCVKDYNIIAFDLREDAALIKSVVEDFGLFVFTNDGKYFYSESFLQRMEIKDEVAKKRAEAGRISASKRKEKSTNVQQVFDKCSTSVQQVKEKKRNISSSEDIKTRTRTEENADDDFIQKFFGQNNMANIEPILMNLGITMKQLQLLTNEIVSEWKATEKKHSSYTDWTSHLIATVRIKLQQNEPNPRKSTNQRRAAQITAAENEDYEGAF